MCFGMKQYKKRSEDRKVRKKHGYSHAVAKTSGFAKGNVDITVALHAKYGAIGLGLNWSFTDTYGVAN